MGKAFRVGDRVAYVDALGVVRSFTVYAFSKGRVILTAEDGVNLYFDSERLHDFFKV